MLKHDVCRHFTGFTQRSCARGIAYRDFEGQALPCLPPYPGTMRVQAVCPLRDFPTAAEVEVDEQRVKEKIRIYCAEYAARQSSRNVRTTPARANHQDKA